MDRFRCDYNVASDLVLTAGQQELTLQAPENYSIILRNGQVDEQGNTAHLIATVIGPATSFDTAPKELRSILAVRLDLLGFMSHARLKIEGARRVIE